MAMPNEVEADDLCWGKTLKGFPEYIPETMEDLPPTKKKEKRKENRRVISGE